MRFSRRNKGPLAWARRTKSRGQDQDSEQEFGPVASEERHALLSNGADSGDDSSGAYDHEDATQHILSALGRFHRQVAKAKVGATQGMWTDECMSELVAAADIAVREGWRETVEVLTETGRILQTYEDAGQARECVSFLSEAYDILSLMVGDLIVGEVRPGVLQKWQDCYAQALEAVESAGLTLIEDEEEREDERAADSGLETSAAANQAANTIPFELPPLDDEDEEYAAASAEDVPTLGSLPPMGESGAEPIDETLLAKEQAREHLSAADHAGEDRLEEAVASLTGSDIVLGAEDENAADSQVSETGDEEDAVGSSDAPHAAEEAEEEPAAATSPENPEIVATLDSFCAGLAKIEKAEDRDLNTVYAAMFDCLAFLDQWAVEVEAEPAQRLSRAMALLCQQMVEGQAAPNDKFLELGYGFCEAFVEATSPDPGAAVETWLEECAALCQQGTQDTESPDAARALAEDSGGEAPGSEVIPSDDLEAALDSMAAEAAASPAAGENDGSPEALLRIAQEAVAGGRTTEAKVFAMQAAAAFAQREAEQSQQRLCDIEHRINEGGMQIESARNELRETEESVAQAEASTREGEEAVAACGEQTLSTRERLDAADSEIEELDARIRELQAQRDAAAERRAEIDGELSKKRDEEAAAEAVLEARRAEEDAARNHLEEARQKVKNLERKRGELELEMERARDYLARHQSSLEDIKQTIAQLRSTDAADAGDSDELLF